MNQMKIDPISVATAFASALFGAELAHFIGPYAVILLASTTGAGWALGRHPPLEGRLQSLWFFARLNMLALLLTVPLAALSAWAFKLEDASWLLAPIALFVGGVGDDWPKVGTWVAKRLGRLIEKRTDTGDSKIGD